MEKTELISKNFFQIPSCRSSLSSKHISTPEAVIVPYNFALSSFNSLDLLQTWLDKKKLSFIKKEKKSRWSHIIATHTTQEQCRIVFKIRVSRRSCMILRFSFRRIEVLLFVYVWTYELYVLLSHLTSHAWLYFIFSKSQTICRLSKLFRNSWTSSFRREERKKKLATRQKKSTGLKRRENRTKRPFCFMSSRHHVSWMHY